MKCKDCGYPAEDCDHTFERIAKPEGDHHILNGQCTKCEDRAVLLSGAEHEFEDDVCKWCGYNRNNNANEAVLPEREGHMGSSNGETDPAPYTLTADGNEIVFTEFLLPYDGSDRNALVLTVDEAITGTTIEWHVTLSGAEALASRGVQTLYLLVNDTEITVLNCVDRLAEAMTQAQLTEFTVTGTPNADVPGGCVFFG